MGESKVGKSWFSEQIFKDINALQKKDHSTFTMLQESTDFSLTQESSKSQNKALKSSYGCQVHTHLLNDYFELQSESYTNALYFLELFEMSGQILEKETMMQCFAHERNFTSLIVCVDLSNSKTISNLPQTIKKGVSAVIASQPSYGGNSLVHQQQSDIHNSVPILVVGCKVDHVDDNR